ncbi:hypothetical protein [Halodesulfovibrio sp.]|jgi:hypothetical protein|uniref:hypothetical protein n=1 Tax=Halodesulfovibrio sp. TaxID=1912772 RepID=UPI0025E918A2|nr:hypothetical protein [Halodesulfovibrio sp.]MCT4534773.1 hypothetical protein [Halodesulfovibrio sp.]
MKKLKKKITVRFFSLNAKNSFYDDFISTYRVNQENDNLVRIFNVRAKKYLIKIGTSFTHQGNESFFLSVVRERNTWQARALSNGIISGVPLNQGILGDPYYYVFLPHKRIILGFTTGPSESLKSTANITLQQFNRDRTSRITAVPVSKDAEFDKLNKLQVITKVKFNVDTTGLNHDDDLPVFLKGMNTPAFQDSKLTFSRSNLDDGQYEDHIIRSDIKELLESDSCSALSVVGKNEEGILQTIRLGNVYAVYRMTLELRDKFVNESKAKELLLEAMSYFDGTN